MIVLGLDTATPQVGCALGDDEGPVASFHLARGRRHAESLAPAIEYVCRQARIELGQLDAVAVDIGPGLFTGLRVGVATGKALAFALGIPMVGVTSLDVLAHPHGGAAGLIAAVVDARRGEVFWALYRGTATGATRLTDYTVSRPEDFAAQLAGRGEEVVAVGDGAGRYAPLLGRLDGVSVAGPGYAHPSAAVLVELAQPRAAAGDVVSAGELEPLYLRQADVRINWVERDRPSPSVVGPSVVGPSVVGPVAASVASAREAG
jgi:tRNA threonylcarbamoyladenosine biosynthesis protein TsaB